ncbi:MAG TPA: hypothetical protein VGU44_02465 [Gammaproteobacteria bacterium]|nr:hypothetical protein [Gammaproteobacteria bacterium]
MATYQNTYGYLKASLYSASPEKAVLKTRSNSNLFDSFESSLEEVIYKSYWEAYFDQRG